MSLYSGASSAPQETRLCLQEENWEGASPQKLALGLCLFYLDSDQAGPKCLRQPRTHSASRGSSWGTYTSCSPVTSCHPFLDVRLDTGPSWSTHRSPLGLSCLPDVSLRVPPDAKAGLSSSGHSMLGPGSPSSASDTLMVSLSLPRLTPETTSWDSPDGLSLVLVSQAPPPIPNYSL